MLFAYTKKEDTKIFLKGMTVMICKLLVNEMRKTLQMKRIYIYTSMAIAISIFSAWYCISTSETYIVEHDGTRTAISGMSAIAYQTQIESGVKREITPESLVQTLHIMQDAYDVTQDNYKIYSEAFFSHRVHKSAITGLIGVYPEYTNDTIGIASTTTLDKIPDDVIYNFYKLRNKKIEQILVDRYGTDTIQLQKALEMNRAVSEPFSFNPGSYYWDTVLEYYSILLTVVLIIVALFTAPIFAECYSNGSDIIFRTTKYGLKYLGIVRVLLSVLYGLFLLSVTSIIFLGISIWAFGNEGLRSSIQLIDIYAIANLTYGELLIYMIVGGAISIIGTVGLTTLLSVKKKNSVNAVVISIIFIIGYQLISLFFDNVPSWVSILISSLPPSGTDMFYMVRGYEVYNFFNVAVWKPYWSVIVGLLLGGMFFVWTISSYRKWKY